MSFRCCKHVDVSDDVSLRQAFDVAEKEFGIVAVTSGAQMAEGRVPDKVIMMTYLSQFYEYFRKESAAAARPAKRKTTTSVYVHVTKIVSCDDVCA